jgi:MATE family multidrug resistance protein
MNWPTRAEFATLIRLALPVVVVQVGLMFMGVVDTMMVGRLSPVALGAAALGNLFFFTVAVIGMGTLMALDPVVAQAVGSGDEAAVARGLQRGLLIAGILTVPSVLGLALVGPFLLATGQPAELIPGAVRYILVIMPGVLPFYVFIVFRQTLQALHRTAPIVWTTVGANLLNAGLNYTFIFGHFGAPALGLAGSALATTISRWVMALALLAAGWGNLRHRLRPWRPDTADRQALGRMFRLGLPLGGQQWLEYGIFALVGVLMGRIGTIAVAGHQIALNLAALVFMVPAGLATAAAVQVGRAIGAGDQPRAHRAANGSLLLGVAFMVATATLFVTLPKALARLYTPDAAVLRVAAPLIVLAGFFAVFDGLQVVTLGVLRGIGDTHAPALISALGYWLVGLPVSLLLGFRAGLGPQGLWWGLVIGLAVTAAILFLRMRRRFGRAVERLVVDHPPAAVDPGQEPAGYISR